MLAAFFLLVQTATEPVRLTLGASPVVPGAAVPVHVETGRDGYVLVLRLGTDGRVSRLFPAADDEGFLPRGAHQLRARTGQALTVSATEGGGTGIVLAAWSDSRPRRAGRDGAALDLGGTAALSAAAERWFGAAPAGAFALYTVRAGGRPAAAAIATAAPPPATAPVPVIVTVVHETAPAVTAPTPRMTVQQALLIASVCDLRAGGCGRSGFRPGRARDREPPVKTEGICQAGVDCPPGVGAPARTLPRPQR